MADEPKADEPKADEPKADEPEKKRVWPKYRPYKLPDDKAAVAGRLAVVYPIHGKGKLTYAGIERVATMWLRRVRLFRAAGYEPVTKKGLFAYYCPPRCSVAVAMRGMLPAQPCTLRGCPWCHAEGVFAVHRRVAVPAPGELVFLSRRLSVPLDKFTAADVTGMCLSAAAANRSLRAAGGLWRVTVDPRSRSAVVTGSVISRVTTGPAAVPGWELSCTPADAPLRLERLVANATRYPAGMIRAPVRSALLVLRTTAGVRMGGVTGAFRAAKGEPETEGGAT